MLYLQLIQWYLLHGQCLLLDWGIMEGILVVWGRDGWLYLICRWLLCLLSIGSTLLLIPVIAACVIDICCPSDGPCNTCL